MKAFFSYYKWHIFFFALFITCFSIFALSSCTKSSPDLIINCISTEYVNVQTFNDTKSDLEEFLHDSDGDKKKHAVLNSYTFDTQNDLDEIMAAVATAKDSDIIITTKETFENFEDKDLFDASTNYVKETGSGKYDVLKDKSGRPYAVSLEDNEYIQNMGFLDTTGLYIAVILDKDDAEDISANKKNARNIAQVIIKERNV